DTVSLQSARDGAKAMKRSAWIDHVREATAVGLKLRDTKLVVFGSPLSRTPAMAAAPLAALDLPLKILVWQDKDQTRVSYAAPAVLAARHALNAELAAPLAGIDSLTDALIES